MFEKKITFDSLIRGIITTMIVIGILYLLDRLSGALLPFFIAWIIAYLMYPLVKFFQYKLKFKSRVISIFCTLIVVISVGTTAFMLLVPPMITEFGKVKDLLVTYFIEGTHTTAIPEAISVFIKNNIDMHWVNRMLSEQNIVNAYRYCF